MSCSQKIEVFSQSQTKRLLIDFCRGVPPFPPPKEHGAIQTALEFKKAVYIIAW